MSKAEAARQTGVTVSYWYRIENGEYKQDGQIKKANISYDVLVKAATTVGLDPLQVLKAAGLTPNASLSPLMEERVDLIARINQMQIRELHLLGSFLDWMESETRQVQNIGQ